jgi:glutamate-1-semialdehyde 2,1-aminomutase
MRNGGLLFSKSEELRSRAHAIIPGGCHTYAKGDDQYPEQSPGFIASGSGCHVIDVDGNEYIEYGMGLRSVTLGYGNERIANALRNAYLKGTNFVRPAPIEIELAEEMLSLFPYGEMIKFGKNGSDVTNAAIRLSRAYTGRDMVAVPANQPFFSVDDWFIGSTPMAAGIPIQVRDLTLKFTYNDIDSVNELFNQYPDMIACLIMEPAKEDDPIDGFLHKVKELCKKNGAIFILDEMITGFRWHLNGAQKYYDVTADLSTYGKAMANGLAVSALIGKREIMEAGGLNHDKERVFLLSLTQGAETSSLAGALEVIRIYKEEDVIGHMWQIGQLLGDRITDIIKELDLKDYFSLRGKPCCMVYGTRDGDKKPSQPFRTLFLQETIKRGLIMPSLIVSYAHKEKDIEQTVDGVGEALIIYKKALSEGIDKYLVGKSVKPVFRQYC